jgi:hypothetical protein
VNEHESTATYLRGLPSTPYDREIDAATDTANEHVALAESYAAELIERLGITTDSGIERIKTLIAVAYLEGQCSQLKWARDKVRGDG